jgi:hypothetical protein
VSLEAIAGADNQYSLLQVFRRGHVITKSGAVAYVTRCNPVEVLPRVSNNCTEKMPILGCPVGTRKFLTTLVIPSLQLLVL